MFRRLLFPVFLALFSLSAFAVPTPVTVSGTNQTVGTTGVQGNSFVRFKLRNFAGFVPKVFGTGIIVQTQIDVLPAADGTFTTPLWSNDDITPNTCGVTQNLACTWYTVEFWNGGRITASGSYCIPNTSSTYDLNVAVPCQTPPLPPGPIQVTNVTGATISGTASHVLKFVGPTTAADSEGIATGTAAAVWPLGTSIATSGLEFQKQNSSSPGTTAYLLAAKDPTTGFARDAQPTDSNALIGITHTGAGTSGSASIVFAGGVLCTFDNQSAIGDWVILGTSSQCHDAGITQPVGVASIAKVTSTNSGAGTNATVDVGLPDVSSNSANTSGGNGTVSPCATNNTVSFYSAIGNTIGCDPLFTDDGAGNLSATSLFLNGTGGGFQFFGQGTQPTLSQANAVYFYAPASVPASFGTAFPSAPGTIGQTLVITAVPDSTHVELGYATSACTGACVETTPTGDQTITGSNRFVISHASTATAQASVEFMGTGSGSVALVPSLVDIITEDSSARALSIQNKAASPANIGSFAISGIGDLTIKDVNSTNTFASGLTLAASGDLAITAQNSSHNVSVTGNVIFATDGASDIGANGANRPRTLYTATSVITPGLTVSGITGSTQCLQADSSGAVTGTGATCAGTSSPGGINTNLQYNNAGAFGGFADGTSTQVLHGGRIFGSVVNADIAAATIDLTTKVTGVLPTANGGLNNGFFAVSGPTTSPKTFTFPNASANVLTSNAAVTVSQGGTNLTSGTSGGILGFTASGTLASSAALTANSPVLGGGAGATPATVAGITSDGVSKFTLGVAGSSVGAVAFNNATSGSVTLQPVTGALASTVISLPAFTGTAVVAATSTTTTQALFATGTAGAPAYRAVASADLPAALASQTSVNGTTIPASVTLTQTIASGTATLGTGAISSGTCATVVTTSATGVATTDVVRYGFNGDPTAVTGYAPSASGMLTVITYPTANNVNAKVCNNTASSITPGAITLNWQVVR